MAQVVLSPPVVMACAVLRPAVVMESVVLSPPVVMALEVLRPAVVIAPVVVLNPPVVIACAVLGPAVAVMVPAKGGPEALAPCVEMYTASQIAINHFHESNSGSPSGTPHNTHDFTLRRDP
jgi:hypothetical protein